MDFWQKKRKRKKILGPDFYFNSEDHSNKYKIDTWKEKGTLLLYMLTILYAQRWKDVLLPTVKKWMIKMTKLVEMAKLIVLIVLIKGKKLPSFVRIWKWFSSELKKDKTLSLGSDDFVTEMAWNIVKYKTKAWAFFILLCWKKSSLFSPSLLLFSLSFFLVF